MAYLDRIMAYTYGLNMHANSWLSNGSVLKSGKDYHVDYCTYVGMLMTTSGGKYWNEPYKAVFDFHGVGDKAIEIAGAYARQQAQNNISRLFSGTPKPEPIKFIDLTLSKSVMDYTEFSKLLHEKMMDSLGIPVDMFEHQNYKRW